MAQLKTTFAGLTLENPIIISSSGLTNSAEKIKKLEEAGAGAVVLKSVFEEQINMQAGSMQGYGSPEADDYLGAYVRSHALNEHISLIQETKKICKIPVIASINCYSDNEWVDFAKTMEDAGADALEINILSLQTTKDYAPGTFEQRHIDILRHIKKVVKVPVIMKLGYNFTNPIMLINQLYANGAAAVVLFNRFYQPDFNIDTLSYTNTNVMSNPSELADRLRWTAIASAEVPQMNYAISGGVHCEKGVIKSILAGASAVEICSVIYQYGSKEIEKMKKELTEWMDDKGYESLQQFKGKMNACAAGDINPFERTQFMKYFSNREE
ncbi:dihydroorotate dehydrogenase-like protein [uncultured Bacteroides sp.]|uniref:dihydroorotate dehydrogenase-like protein n=1 Tax=uncultured Bacteroides sp. TaxID=162156 RepID=UPI002635FD62|nr:dihydroorotate dehydrogenase-like protein [uncultured Bacteroides sp.]